MGGARLSVSEIFSLVFDVLDYVYFKCIVICFPLKVGDISNLRSFPCKGDIIARLDHPPVNRNNFVLIFSKLRNVLLVFRLLSKLNSR